MVGIKTTLLATEKFASRQMLGSLDSTVQFNVKPTLIEKFILHE